MVHENFFMLAFRALALRQNESALKVRSESESAESGFSEGGEDSIIIMTGVLVVPFRG